MLLSKLLAVLFISSAVATSTPVIAPVEPTVKGLIVKYSEQYGIDLRTSLAVARCESNFKPEAVGDNGLAKNVYQFHFSTFTQFAKELGEPLNYENTEDNIRLANWAFAKGYGPRHWTCWPK